MIEIRPVVVLWLLAGALAAGVALRSKGAAHLIANRPVTMAGGMAGGFLGGGLYALVDERAAREVYPPGIAAALVGALLVVFAVKVAAGRSER